MDTGRGRVYDIFFDASMPVDALRLLSGRRRIHPDELFILELYANIGDIAENFWEERYKLMSWYDAISPAGSGGTDEKYWLLRARCEAVASAREGTDVLRIWHGVSAADICALAFVLDLVKGRELTMIDMPLDGMFRFSDLADAPREVVYRAFGGSGLLGGRERNYYEELWRSLSEENAPIRTKDPDGNVIGASDDFFDGEILLKIPDEGCLFSEALKDLREDRRLDDMGKLFWTRRLVRLISKGLLEAGNGAGSIFESIIKKK